MARSGRSAASDVKPSSVPIGSEKGVDNTILENSVPISVDVVRNDPDGEGLYWFGALPAEGKQVILMQPAEGQPPNPEREDGRVEVEMTAMEAWYPKAKGQPPIWLGRCRWYQNLGVTGAEFVAFSEERVREAANESRNFLMAWPGRVAVFHDAQLRAILESVRNHAIRPKSETVADVVNYMHGHMVGCEGPLRGCTCSKIEAEIPQIPETRRRVMRERPRVGDLPMADFVYLRRLNVPVTYDPKLYYRLVPSMEQFLMHPPEPLSADLAKMKEAETAAATG